ncbi:depupylase/deamidase Dop [Propionibacteriaceae bacterium Y2011]
MGIETEYGISVERRPGDDPIHPMHLSNIVVRGYADATQRGRAGWDYATESPLQDVRGVRIPRATAHPDLLTDADTGMANVVLTNGARFYVDHAHPEYSGPEVTTARDAVVWDRAGDLIMVDAARRATELLGRAVRVHKNNTDGKGSSYGTHENYLLDRDTPFSRVVTQFTGFLVSRQPVIGAGRIGLGQASEQAGFQISQRADFFEAPVGLETTMNRPIINTRDEPHSDPRRYRRLHVITGDATQAEWSTWLKVGTASLTLRALAAGHLADVPQLADPVPAMQQVSHDPTCRALVRTEHGDRVTAVELQRAYLAGCRTFVAAGEFGSERQYAEAGKLLDAWQDVLDTLERDPLELRDRLEWVAKWSLLQSYVDRDGLPWSAPKLALIDLQFCDLDPERGLYAALERRGRIRRLVDPAEVAAAVTRPPDDTRAHFRGRVMDKFGESVVAASWDTLILDVPGRRTLQRLELVDPFVGDRASTAALVDDADSVTALVAAWSGLGGPDGGHSSAAGPRG